MNTIRVLNNYMDSLNADEETNIINARNFLTTLEYIIETNYTQVPKKRFKHISNEQLVFTLGNAMKKTFVI